MNTFRYLATLCGCALLMLCLSGCLETTTTTQVNRNGSLVRIQVISGDSTEVLSDVFPTPIDSTWTVTVNRQEKGGFERVASKLFRDAGELSAWASDTSRPSLRFRGNLEKHFLWFFTELVYREKYLDYNAFRSIPLSEYVTQAEMDRFYRHEYRKEPYATKADSLAEEEAGKRFEEWRARNVFEGYYGELVKGVQALADPTLTPTLLAAHKEEVYEQTREWIEGAGNMDTLQKIVQKVFKLPQVRKAIVLNEAGFAAHKAKLSFMENLIGHLKQTNIIMPGLITDTNAPTIEGNTASWKELATLAYLGDYEIWVKSRVVNWWAVVIAGAVVLLAIALFVTGSIRRRQRAIP
jgi:hypothetical protein